MDPAGYPERSSPLEAGRRRRPATGDRARSWDCSHRNMRKTARGNTGSSRPVARRCHGSCHVARSRTPSGFDRSSLTFADDRSLVSRRLSATGSIACLASRPAPVWHRARSARTTSRSRSSSSCGVCRSSPSRCRADTETARTLLSSPFTIVASAFAMVVCAAGLLRDSLAQRIPDMYGSRPCSSRASSPTDGAARPHGKVTGCRFEEPMIAVAIGLRPRHARARARRRAGSIRRTGIRRDRGRSGNARRTVFQHTREWPWVERVAGWKRLEGCALRARLHPSGRPPADDVVGTRNERVLAPRVCRRRDRAAPGVPRSLELRRRGARTSLARSRCPSSWSIPDGLEDFYLAYPAIAKYLDARFRKVGEFTPDARKIHIYVDASRTPTGADAEFGWPCFAAQSAPASAGSLSPPRGSRDRPRACESSRVCRAPVCPWPARAPPSRGPS